MKKILAFILSLSLLAALTGLAAETHPHPLKAAQLLLIQHPLPSRRQRRKSPPKPLLL